MFKMGMSEARRPLLHEQRICLPLGCAALADRYFPQNTPNDFESTAKNEGSPTRGTFLDVTIGIRDPEGRSFVDAVIAEFATQRQLRRKRHRVEIENELSLVQCMLANALRCHWYRRTSIVSYQRKADAACYKYRNRPAWFSAQALGRAASLLADIGLVQLQLGVHGTASGFFATSRLSELAAKHEVSDRSLRKWLPREDLVQLKSMKPRAIFDRATRTLTRSKAPRIRYEPTAITDAWCDTLAAYNEFVATQDVKLDLPTSKVEQWLHTISDHHLHAGAKLSGPELFRSSLYRVFNDGTDENPVFERGGRLVGAWWINAPEEVRRCIKINGEPVVELDYRACHPRMLYHERGLEAPADPYDLPPMQDLESSHGRAKGAYRPIIKWLTQILINGRGRPDLVSLPEGMNLPDATSLRDLCQIIEREHAVISNSFGSGAGLRLMKIESDIALTIIDKARAHGTLVLPIHDSFIIQKDLKNKLKERMTQEYWNVMNYKPIIVKTY